MDALQRGLRRGIPMEKAASYFVGLKRGHSLPPEDDAIMAQAVKQAAQALTPPRPAAPAPKVAAARPAPVTELPQVKSASLRWKLLVGQVKEADFNMGQAAPGGAAMASPTPADVPEKENYLANEQAGLEAESTAAIDFYRQKLEEARAQTEQLTAENQQLSQQVEQLTGVQGGHDDQLMAHQQEGQIAQQAAMQQVQTANEAAAQAMQQAVEASNAALQAKGQEAAAKIEQQKVRTQLFELASQGLPGSEPELGGAGSAAEGLETGMPPQPSASMQQDPAGGAAPQPGAEGGEGAPSAGLNQVGEPASAEGMPGQEATPEAPGAAVGPTALQPPADTSGGAGSGSSTGPQSNSDGGPSAPEQDPSAKRTGQVSIKVGHDLEQRYQRLLARRAPPADRQEEDHRLSMAAKAASAALPSFLRSPQVLGALGGGLLGAGAAGLEAAGHGPNLDDLRGRIAEGEEGVQQPGLRGFGKAFDLAKNRALLTLGEATQSHPAAATITGGLMGAGVGSQVAPRLMDLVREAVQLHK